MKVTTKFFMVALILSLMLTVSAVAAADDISFDKSDTKDRSKNLLSTDDGKENLKTNEKTLNDETLSAKPDDNKLGDGQYNYTYLKDQIGNGRDITLNNGTYTYTSGDGNTITISNSCTIDGNGSVIDMANSNKRAFYVTASGVTIKNLTIKNALSNQGGAIYFTGTGTVTNCNFINNTASDYGGAIYFYSNGNVTNCNFNGNTASKNGGAIYFTGTGTVTNCNFNGNTASSYGGAIYFLSTGNVTNCNFNNNRASDRGGAIYSLKWATTADTCIFKTSSDSTVNVVFRSPTLDVDNFTTFYGSGEKLTFDLKTFSGMTVDNGNISIEVYDGNNVSIGNYSCLSGEGWIVNLSAGLYYAVFNTEYEDFQEIKRTITVSPNNTFWALNNTINSNNNPVINLTNDFYFDPNFDNDFIEGIVINRSVTINGNGYTIDAKGKARIFQIAVDVVVLSNLTFVNGNATGGGAIYFENTGTVINCRFTNNSASSDGGAICFIYSGSTVKDSSFTDNFAKYGGAICFENSGSVENCDFVTNAAGKGNGCGGAIYFRGDGDVTDCNFTANTALGNGGAIHFDNPGNAANCNFINNSASRGGAVYIDGGSELLNCHFTGNNAISGSAIYLTASGTNNIYNSRFLNNKANATLLHVFLNETNITITFTGQNNILNAIWSNGVVNFTNVTYWGEKGIMNTDDGTYSVSNKEAGQNITVIGVVNGNIINTIKSTDASGKIVLENISGEYYLTISHDEDSYYTMVKKIFTNMNYTVNVTAQTTTNKTVNITAKSNIYRDVMPGELIFIFENGDVVNASYAGDGIWWGVYAFADYGKYNVNASYIGLDNVTINNSTITVNKAKTVLTADSVTTTYNVNKYIVITLKDENGNPLKGVSISVDLNGVKKYTTDANGQVKVPTKGLAPKTYTAKVTFNGNTNYEKSAINVKVTVKKLASKITAGKKTFKAKTKVKKYVAVLKDSTGKAIKNAKLTLKVKGKTYAAKTNSKGKAIFKITKLNKKGTFKGVIKFNGNAYYTKSSKNVKIIVKASKSKTTFKTISKGSKDKNTVKKIQRALKNNGYYLSYQGHYLKVDGIYESCTERSVMVFQKDHGLKVTGKVDAKTAKKLGII